MQRSRVGDLLLSACFLGVFGSIEVMVKEAELEPATGEILNGGDFVEKLLQSLSLKVIKGIKLDLDKVWHINDGRYLGVGSFNWASVVTVGYLQSG